MKWPEVKLRDFCRFRHGGTPSKARSDFWNGDIPWVSPKDMRQSVIRDSEDHITRKAVDEDGALLVPPRSILIVVRSGILVRTVPVALTAVETAFNQDMKSVEVDSEVASPEFVFWYLKSSQQEMLTQGVKRGATVHSIQSGFIESLSMPVPAPREQNRIVELLEQADALRQKRAAADALADRILPALFHKLFGDPATNPKGWPTENLLRVCSPRQWPTISSQELLEDGYPVFGANGRIGYYSSYNHEHPTVLITCRGATCGTVNICEPKSYVTGNSMALDDPDDSKTNLEFLESFLRCRGLRDTITGAAQPQITRTNLGVVNVFVPPKPLRDSFADQRRRFGQMIQKMAASKVSLEGLFATMLHRAFTGELTAQWREAHLKELLAEMEQQAKALNLPANGKN